MTDDEAATLLGIAYDALLMIPAETRDRLALRRSMTGLQYEIARLRGRTPEDIQNEFEGKGR